MSSSAAVTSILLILAMLPHPVSSAEVSPTPDPLVVRANTERILAIQNSRGFNAANDYYTRIGRRQRFLQTVDVMLSLPESEFDIWKVSLTLARNANPSLDLKTLTEEFEGIVEQAREMTPTDASPDHRIRTLNTLLFKKLGIEYDKTDYMGRKPINRYVYGVVQTRKGTCANLAAFYIAVAQRLGWPVYAVAAPQHLFARYVDPTLEMQNIDPTSQGGWDSDEEYIRKTEIPQKAIDNGVYLRTMTYKELAAELIADHGAYYYGTVQRDYQGAADVMEKALRNSPRASESWNILGQIYDRMSRREWDPDVREALRMKGVFFKNRSGELGIGQPLRDDYWKKPPPQKAVRGPDI
jgi:regulator of sirC expression with transglutaminase-like and TPR domain